jgi:hypothetical protein
MSGSEHEFTLSLCRRAVMVGLKSNVDLVGAQASRGVCILGMHRSGTSCLAGSLEEAGLYLGEVFRVGRHNAKGNRENGRIMALQEAVLVDGGGSWNRPPKQVGWTDSHRAERDAIIRSYGDVRLWGFKDPRTLILVDFWREAIPDLMLVATLRHPRFVAESLHRRGGGSIDDWLDLWATYNERLLALHQASPFPIVRFDLGEQGYCRSLALAMAKLNLVAPTRMAFFDPILRHHETLPPDPLPERISRLYDTLCSIAVDG